MKLAWRLLIAASLLAVCVNTSLINHSNEENKNDNEDILQAKKQNFKEITVKMEVGYDTKEYPLDAKPIMNYVPNKGTLIEGCIIQQGSLIEDTNRTQSYVDKFPVSMHNRWYLFLGYKDSQYMIYREDKFKPFTSVRFTRAGMTSDILDLPLETISGKEDKHILFMRDMAEDNGPSLNKTSSLYIYVHPTTIIYHEIDFLGKSVKSMIYNTDNELSIIDAVTHNKKMFVVTSNSLEAFTVNENMMKKELEIIIPVNTVAQLGYSRGKLFVMTIKTADGGMELIANDKLSLEGYYTHLKGKHVDLIASGNRNYVVFVKDDFYQDKGSYYYLINPKASKPSSMVWQKIPEINTLHPKVFELRDRIHFIKDTEHKMYTKGALKTLIRLKNTLPLLGLLYWSYYQYPEEDQFLVVSDIASSGNLKVTSVNLTNPKVICPPRIGTVEKYEKFSVVMRKEKYNFEVLFQTTGTQGFISATLFDQVMCLLFGIAVAGFAYIWMQKAANDRDFERINKALAKRRGKVAEDESHEKDLLEEIEKKMDQEQYADVDVQDSLSDDDDDHDNRL